MGNLTLTLGSKPGRGSFENVKALLRGGIQYMSSGEICKIRESHEKLFKMMLQEFKANAIIDHYKNYGRCGVYYGERSFLQRGF